MSAASKDIKIVNEKIVENATCTFCGCCCDDITLTVDMDKKVITKAKDACVLGKSWFLNHVIEDKPIARIAGKEVPLDDAINEAAKQPNPLKTSSLFLPNPLTIFVSSR